MSDIPSEIVVEFLSRVPAQSLLRFRSVSKKWRSIIDSPRFIKLHLHRALQTESDRKIVLRGDGYFFWADLDLVEKTKKVHYTKLDCPFESKSLVTNVIGSCHGVLCLGGDFEDETIALWNPTTREMFKIPSSTLSDNCHLGLGFGYDNKSDDYKVLRIIQRVHAETEARVYSMKLKTWRKIDRFPFHLKHRMSNGVLASGSLHFKCSSIDPEGENDVIGAFDLETEEYRLVPHPEFPAENGNFHMNVEALGGSLCMMCYYGQSRSLDIWVNEKSWTKLLTIGEPDCGGLGSFLSVSYVKPLAYSRSGREVFMAHGDMIPLWYDVEKRAITYVDFNVSYKMAFMEHHLSCASLVN
ncbi:unnamed protein product [Cuscuta campestris]|uniref:F-box domain-containing protein n=1 Tax=Cuscuta campestris TaxID=132261 RepID=A0A484L5E2_9ASTE|nr:unnamed protein product [Cuscuta campestris]